MDDLGAVFPAPMMIPGLDLVLQFSWALGEHIPKETFPRAGTTVEKGQHYPGGYRGAGSAVFMDSSVHSLSHTMPLAGTACLQQPNSRGWSLPESS